MRIESTAILKILYEREQREYERENVTVYPKII